MRSTSSDLRGRRLLVGLFASVVLLAGACGNSGDDEGSASADEASTTTAADTGGAATSISGVPGVTDDEIKFAAFGTITQNPLGTCVLECYVQGIQAYFDYRNSEGGADGRKLVLGDVLDDQLSKNQEKALEIVSKKDSFGAFSAAQLGSGWGDIAKAGMPLYVWNISPQDAAHPEIFGNPQSTICLECPRQINGLIIKDAKAKKIGILGYGVSENSKLAAQATQEAVELYSDEIGGAEVAYFNDNIPFGVPNGVGPEVTKMKDEGVDLIFGSLDLNAMKTLAQELERQGMGDVPMVHANTYDQDFVKEAGELFEGDIVTLAIRPFEAESGESDLDLFKEWMDKSGHEPVEVALYGWIAARTAYDGIVAAGPEFDQAKVIAASNEQFSAYTAGGLLPPQDYTKPHEVPTAATLGEFGPERSCMAMVEVKGGEFEVVGDAAKPFFCWPGNTVDWSEPEVIDAK
jgi:ABC-type branched-subunit amino acid transport system substrate-binding protein